MTLVDSESVTGGKVVQTEASSSFHNSFVSNHVLRLEMGLEQLGQDADFESGTLVVLRSKGVR